MAHLVEMPIMNEQEQSETVAERLPEGFFLVRFDHVLYIISMTIVVSSMIASKSALYVLCILLPLVLVLGVVSVIARRGVRKFVREHGEVEITFRYSPASTGPKKNVLFREVGGLIDEGIDRVLDRRGQDNP